MIVVDGSAITAHMNSANRRHTEVAQLPEAEENDLVTTPLIFAEADHLAGAYGRARAARALRGDLVAGAYLAGWWPEALVASARGADRYAEMNRGLADASLVAVAQRSKTTAIATLDGRHFRVLRPLAGAEAFRLLPRDC